MNKAKGLILITFILIVSLQQSYASDTLVVSIKQADSLFLANNYYLLASGMNIDIQKAKIIQAKLYPNPNFTADFNAYDPQNKIPFHVGQTGQKSFQFDQLIIIGGKRKAQIELAKSSLQIAEIEFQDVIRQLKYKLHTSLYMLNQQAFVINQYSRQLALLDTILKSYTIQVKKGNIALKDEVRLKSVYLTLNSSRAAIYKSYFDELAVVRTILQSDKVVVPVIFDNEIAAFVKPISLSELTDIALQNRPDYLITLQNNVIAEQYFAYQKKNAVPDVRLITSYDQRGGAFVNQFNIGFSMSLPFLDRNQGNIKAAQIQIKQSGLNAEVLKIQLLADVQNNFSAYKQNVLEYQKSAQLYDDSFESTIKGVVENFKKGNVSMLEFVDFFERYNNVLEEMARIKIQLAISAEQINYSTGKEIY